MNQGDDTMSKTSSDIAGALDYPENMAILSKSGWEASETELLFAEVENARREGKPLKMVFDKVAKATGRKPNSIRNYYYNKIKNMPDDETLDRQTAFTPFKKEQIWDLMVTVLGAQARGISVRACTLALGNGDKKEMLRYQNKYRSVIKNNPVLVKQVMDYMKEKNISCFDPYAIGAIDGRRGHSGRKPDRERIKMDMIDVVSGLVEDMRSLEDLDIMALFKGMKQLTGMACGKLKESGQDYKAQLLMAEDREQEMLIKAKEFEVTLAESQNRISLQQARLENQRNTINSLLLMLRQLIKVNRDFLGLNSVIKVSNLGTYIMQLAKSIEDCERAMKEYAV